MQRPTVRRCTPGQRGTPGPRTEQCSALVLGATHVMCSAYILGAAHSVRVRAMGEAGPPPPPPTPHIPNSTPSLPLLLPSQNLANLKIFSMDFKPNPSLKVISSDPLVFIQEMLTFAHFLLVWANPSFSWILKSVWKYEMFVCQISRVRLLSMLGLGLSVLLCWG